MKIKTGKYHTPELLNIHGRPHNQFVEWALEPTLQQRMAERFLVDVLADYRLSLNESASRVLYRREEATAMTSINIQVDEKGTS